MSSPNGINVNLKQTLLKHDSYDKKNNDSLPPLLMVVPVGQTHSSSSPGLKVVDPIGINGAHFNDFDMDTSVLQGTKNEEFGFSLSSSPESELLAIPISPSNLPDPLRLDSPQQKSSESNSDESAYNGKLIKILTFRAN